MLDQISLTIAITIAGGAAFQLLLSFTVRLLLSRQKIFLMPIEQQHATAVLICVRGCDPTLESAIQGILNQNYDEYDVHVIVDHRSDAAWDLLHSLKESHDHDQRMHIHEMPTPEGTVGLKCHALVSGMQQIDPGTQFVALMDADVKPHPNWLQELTGPLTDPSIGISTGNQWFEPSCPASLGGLTRSVWNAGALVPTLFFQNPWAGSLAMRMEDIRTTGLVDIWKRSLVDDGPIREAFQKQGLKIHFSPSIIMINRENSELPFVRNWIARMLTWSRLYEQTFFTTAIHATLSTIILLAAFAMLMINVLTGNWSLALLSLTSLLISGSFSTLAWLSVRAGANYSCRMRGETLPPLSAQRLAGVFLMISIAQLLYAAGCFRAIFANEIRWREVTYAISNRHDFEMTSYQPIANRSDETAAAKVSI